jgi:uncharacterized protein (DUF1330 family)
MTAYVIAEIDVHDADLYREYAALVPATLEPYGGRFIVRGGQCETLEGGWQPPRMVVLEFPTSERARTWYTSAGYGAALQMRQRASTGKLILVEGAG